MSLENELEEELQLELAKLDFIFRGTERDEPVDSEIKNCLSSASRAKKSYSAYEFAEADCEREELQNKLHLLLSKTEEFDAQLFQMNKLNMDLKAQNKTLEIENRRLQQNVNDTTPSRDMTECEMGVSYSKASLELKSLEVKNAELYARLTRIEKAFHDMSVAKDALVQELEHERMMRIHLEKERDAYSAAYEASLQHFEKWTRSKLHPVDTGAVANV